MLLIVYLFQKSGLVFNCQKGCDLYTMALIFAPSKTNSIATISETSESYSNGSPVFHSSSNEIKIYEGPIIQKHKSNHNSAGGEIKVLQPFFRYISKTINAINEINPKKPDEPKVTTEKIEETTKKEKEDDSSKKPEIEKKNEITSTNDNLIKILSDSEIPAKSEKKESVEKTTEISSRKSDKALNFIRKADRPDIMIWFHNSHHNSKTTMQPTPHPVQDHPMSANRQTTTNTPNDSKKQILDKSDTSKAKISKDKHDNSPSTSNKITKKASIENQAKEMPEGKQEKLRILDHKKKELDDVNNRLEQAKHSCRHGMIIICFVTFKLHIN